jgi:hypothetical protein
MVRIWGLRLFLLMLSLSLVGCLRPLYGPGLSAEKKVPQKLSSVDIDITLAPETSAFLGHELRKFLRFQLTGGGEDRVLSRYRLHVNLSEVSTPALFDMHQGIATNVLLSATGDFSLVPLQGKENSLLSGKAATSVILYQNPQGFANVREARDAHIRVARMLADQIYYRLVTYFSRHSEVGE